MPVGIKNPTSGDIQPAINAAISSSLPHTFLSLSESGNLAVVSSEGNTDPHVVLRGGGGLPFSSSQKTDHHVLLVEGLSLSPPLYVTQILTRYRVVQIRFRVARFPDEDRSSRDPAKT